MTLMSKSKQNFALIKSGGNHIIEKHISSCIQNLYYNREQIFKEWLKLKQMTTWIKPIIYTNHKTYSEQFDNGHCNYMPIGMS